MTYEIHEKSDFVSGPCLVVRIPEDEIDHNALYTIEADCPDFILPFSYKSINGQTEFVYRTGAQSKLQYFSGELSQKEYIDLWINLLNPLLECGDWFMNPCSFVMDTEYLYYDKNKKSVKYVYIPSVNGYSGSNSLIEMAVDISKIMAVSDAVLENKVLRAIIKDFSPVKFIKMLKDYSLENPKAELNDDKPIIAPVINERVLNEPVDLTQNIPLISDGSGFRYIGRANLPPFIQILIDRGQIFTIGRFDAAIGKKQSNFEFDKKTKAVSRRHAAIERDNDGYKIIDLSSSAGTLVNDKKLNPNTPHRLETGNRVSFGNSGADYVWEAN